MGRYYVIACNDYKADFKGCNGMYISALNNIYFWKDDQDWEKQRWKVNKLGNVPNSDGPYIHEGDIISIESDYNENLFLQTMRNKSREHELECSKIRNSEGLDEHCWVVMKSSSISSIGQEMADIGSPTSISAPADQPKIESFTVEENIYAVPFISNIEPPIRTSCLNTFKKFLKPKEVRKSLIRCGWYFS